MQMKRTSSAVAGAYDRVARFYDLMEAPMDWMGGTERRRRVLARATGEVLEIGVGTGINFEHYPEEVTLRGIDLSEQMLRRAAQRTARIGRPVVLERADVEALPYADATFDTVTATCVFCSVADPVQGLREVRRVVRPGGRVLLLEHVRPENPLLGALADLITPLVRRLIGPELNRRTEENVRAAGLAIVAVRRAGVWREIEAVPDPRR